MKRFLTIIGVLVMAYAVYNNLWAEPDKPAEVHEQITPTVTVSYNAIAKTDDEQELEVSMMETSEAAQLEEELYYDSLELLALLVQSEAGNQPIEGKKLVADVVLNRVDDPEFPNDIKSVIESDGQFAVVRNGAINQVEPDTETWQAVREELDHRTDKRVLYFRTGKYHSCGTPLMQVGDHYFSGK